MPANDAALEALIEALRAKGEPDPVGRAHAIAAATTRIGRVYRGHHARATHPICLRKASHRLFIRDIACTSLKGQGRATPCPVVRITVETDSHDFNVPNASASTAVASYTSNPSWEYVTLQFERVPPAPTLIVEVIDRVLPDEGVPGAVEATEQIIAMRRVRTIHKSGRIELPLWSTADGRISAIDPGEGYAGESRSSITFSYSLLTRFAQAGAVIRRGMVFYQALESTEDRLKRLHERDVKAGFLVVLMGHTSPRAHAFCERLARRLQGGVVSCHEHPQWYHEAQGSTAANLDHTPQVLSKMIVRERTLHPHWRFALLDDFCQTERETRAFEHQSTDDRKDADSLHVLHAICLPELNQKVMGKTRDERKHMKGVLSAAANFEASGRLLRLSEAPPGEANEDVILNGWIHAAVNKLRVSGIAVPMERRPEDVIKRIQRAERIHLSMVHKGSVKLHVGKHVVEPEKSPPRAPSHAELVDKHAMALAQLVDDGPRRPSPTPDAGATAATQPYGSRLLESPRPQTAPQRQALSPPATPHTPEPPSWSSDSPFLMSGNALRYLGTYEQRLARQQLEEVLREREPRGPPATRRPPPHIVSPIPAAFRAEAMARAAVAARARAAYKAAVVAEAHGPSYESRKHQFQKRRPPPSTPTFVLERRLQTLLQVPAPKTRPLPHSAPTTPRSPRWRSPPSKPVRGTARQLVTSPRVRRLTNNPYDINAAGFSQYLETMPEPREGGLWIGTGNPS